MKSEESGKLPLKFVGFAKFSRPPSKLNSTASSENSPIRRSSKMTLGKLGDRPSYGDVRRNLVIESPFELLVKSPAKSDGGKDGGSMGDYGERLREEVGRVSWEKDREIGDLRTECDIMKKERDFEKKLAFDE